MLFISQFLQRWKGEHKWGFPSWAEEACRPLMKQRLKHSLSFLVYENLDSLISCTHMSCWGTWAMNLPKEKRVYYPGQHSKQTDDRSAACLALVKKPWTFHETRSRARQIYRYADIIGPYNLRINHQRRLQQITKTDLGLIKKQRVGSFPRVTSDASAYQILKSSNIEVGIGLKNPISVWL